jgi:predicted aspartyl protease
MGTLAASAVFTPDLLSAAKAQAQTTQPPVEVPKTDPQINSETDTASLDAQTNAVEQLTVEVKVNDRGPYRFIVDTGAERSVLANTVADELALPTVGVVLIDGVIQKVTSRLVAVRDVAYGPFHMQNAELPVLLKSDLVADGLLGIDALKGSRVTFDFKNDILRVEKSPTSRPPSVGEGPVLIVRASGVSGRLRSTDCVIDGVRTTVFIDTGAQTTIGNPALREALLKRNPQMRELGEIGLLGVTGGRITGMAYSVKEIRMHNLLFATGAVVIADVDIFNTWGLKNKPGLLLGMDFLRQFGAVAIDYRRREIQFELAGFSANPGPLVRPVGS